MIHLRIPLTLAAIACILMAGEAQQAYEHYYPDRGEWKVKTAHELGMNAAQLQAAVQFAVEQESPAPRDLELNHYLSFGREPFGDAVGPHKTRGPATGLIIKDGYLVTKWGEPERVDMTFSVTKSFLSTTVGLAYDQGLIRDIDDRVHPYMAPIIPLAQTQVTNKADQLGQPKVLEPFTGEHNSTITWNHLLRQTSDWQGTLWGKPDWADRPSGQPSDWMTRERHEAGSVFEYNDTRVNLLALAATNLWRTPLPQVLRRAVMDPIGASPTWRWLGYENSWILIDGQAVQVPSGGGHWGGGMMINAMDQARFGYLTLRRGKWRDKQILSERWVSMALTPTQANDTYGFMNWFLNTRRERLPSAPETAFFHLGAGTNMVYVDPENELVIVARWIQREAMDGLVRRVLEAIETTPSRD